MAVQQLSAGGSDGTCFGQSGDKISFLGATPSAQGTLTALATGATIATVVSSVQEIIAELQSKGLCG